MTPDDRRRRLVLRHAAAGAALAAPGVRVAVAAAAGVAPAVAATAATAAAAPAALPTAATAAVRLPLIRPPRLRPGDTLALVNPSGAIHEREPYEIAHETLAALGFRVREAPHLRARHGHLAGTDAERAGDLQAMFADPAVDGILALTGGSGANRLLRRLDYAAIARTPKFFGGFSDITALLNAIHARTGLVTFHGPVGASEWNAFSAEHWRAVAMDGTAPLLLRNPVLPDDHLVPRQGRTRTLRGGIARGPLVGGNLAVFSSLAGSGLWPRLDGAVLFLEEVNEYLYRVDRMLSTLALAGAFDRLAAVVLGAFTNCTPGDGRYGMLTLDEIVDEHLGVLGVPVYSGASFGHIRRKFTLPLGVEAEVDADAGTLRLLAPAVT